MGLGLDVAESHRPREEARPTVELGQVEHPQVVQRHLLELGSGLGLGLGPGLGLGLGLGVELGLGLGLVLGLGTSVASSGSYKPPYAYIALPRSAMSEFMRGQGAGGPSGAAGAASG